MSNFRIIPAGEAPAAKRDAYSYFVRRLRGSGLAITDDAAKRWWGIDFASEIPKESIDE